MLLGISTIFPTKKMVIQLYTHNNIYKPQKYATNGIIPIIGLVSITYKIYNKI